MKIEGTYRNQCFFISLMLVVFMTSCAGSRNSREKKGLLDNINLAQCNNLMLLENKTVIGLPGCARSPKLNGFDWVLQRTLAGVPVSREDIMRMGAGGL